MHRPVDRGLLLHLLALVHVLVLSEYSLIGRYLLLVNDTLLGQLRVLLALFGLVFLYQHAVLTSLLARSLEMLL